MKKIVIVPSFCESHLLEPWIQNTLDVINPDCIVINHGLFPNGPENRGHVGCEFKEKWSGLVESDKVRYQEIEVKYQNKVYINFVEYDRLDISDANDAFLFAISNLPEHIDFEPGDVIFPIEIDCFTHEKNKAELQNWIDQTPNGFGFKTRWVDFLETQFYTEKINEFQPKYRRFCFKFDTLQHYLQSVNGFTSQSYPNLTQCDDFISYHYCWFKPDEFKQLRFDLIHRSNPQYWKDFDNGLNEIREYSERHVQTGMPDNFMPSVVIRPSRSDEGRYAKFIDVEHPNAIRNHPNFVK